MARRRRGCRTCGRPVKWFLGATGGRWRPFEPAPVDRTGSAPQFAFPVENDARWWDPRDLVEDLMVRHEYSRGEAETEAEAMPWYAPHTCPQRPDDQEAQLHADDQPGTAAERHEDRPVSRDRHLERERYLVRAGGRR